MEGEREEMVFGLVALAQNLINSLDGCICCQLILLTALANLPSGSLLVIL